jgi:hypothetical protein
VVEAFDGADVLGPGEGAPSGIEPITVVRSVVMSCTHAIHQNCGEGGVGGGARTFRLIEDIAQPARAPAAPVALDIRSAPVPGAVYPFAPGAEAPFSVGGSIVSGCIVSNSWCDMDQKHVPKSSHIPAIWLSKLRST